MPQFVDPLVDARELARLVRISSLKMCHTARASHVGSCLSAADLLAVLYRNFLRVDPTRPRWIDRDRFIMSKGHAAAAHYAVLAHSGFIAKDALDTYCAPGSLLGGHSSHHVNGVELSTGSLGHGLAVAAGMALCGKREGRPFRVVSLLSDGECDEGSTWEAALFAQHHSLDNLIAIVDWNKLQSFGRVDEVLRLEPFEAKWQAFRWATRTVDGHDLEAVRLALEAIPFEPGRPSVILAHTVKGKGVSFMEDKLEWHYRSPSAEQLRIAMEELERKP